MILVVELLGQPQSGRLVQLELEGVVDADVLEEDFSPAA